MSPANSTQRPTTGRSGHRFSIVGVKTGSKCDEAPNGYLMVFEG
jgi:hypothetical protein